MKPKLIFAALVCLIFLAPLNFALAQDGVKFYPSASAGIILQEGETGAFAWGGKGLIPFVSDSTCRQIFGLEPELITSNFGGHDILIGKAYTTYERPFFTLLGLPWQIGLGCGGWADLKAPGDDDLAYAAKGFVSARAPYIDFELVAEAAMYDGPDIYFLGLQVKFTN